MPDQSLSRQPLPVRLQPGERPPFACIALLLQGGGALGAYQAGLYQALAEANLQPDWVAGISIGAINAAIIAGNAPDRRVDRLREFWESVTDDSLSRWTFGLDAYLFKGDRMRELLNQFSATRAIFKGIPGFFTPRVPAPWLQPSGTIEATSYCDTSALKTTLENLVDFDRLNTDGMRFSVGAVNVTSGNFAYFDTMTHTIRAEHVMASGALPPGFPAVMIDGEYYWDGGIVSNTPLQWVLEDGPAQDTLAFQVDLWSARGVFPRNMSDVAVRQKDIQYSSRTRENTDKFKEMQNLRHALAKLLPQLPEELQNTPEFDLLSSVMDHSVYNIVHCIYRPQKYEGDSKDYEFSRKTMEEHWNSGYQDALRALRHPEILERPQGAEGVFIYDFGN